MIASNARAAAFYTAPPARVLHLPCRIPVAHKDAGCQQLPPGNLVANAGPGSFAPAPLYISHPSPWIRAVSLGHEAKPGTRKSAAANYISGTIIHVSIMSTRFWRCADFLDNS